MSYTPFLIANWNTGVDTRLQPWLIPDDAQEQLLDGYVYRGVMGKREGYTYFAVGERGDQPYCESRIVNGIVGEQVRQAGVLVQGNGTTGPYAFQLQNSPVRRGTVVITAGAQTATDDGEGGFTGDVSAGSINYTTGAVSVTFNANVAGGTQIYATYDYHPGLPVMAIMNFVDATNVKKLIVADTKRLNIYDSTKNILTYLGRTTPITGLTQANPGVVTAVNHGLQTGDRAFIYGVLGMVEVNNNEYTITRIDADNFSIVDTSGYTAYTSAGTVQLIHSGATEPAINFYSWVNYPDKDNNPRLLFSNNKDEIGYYAPAKTPSVGDYVFYPSSAAPEFHMLTSASVPVAVTTITCSTMAINKDRLLLLRTTENGTVYPQRIRISGTGASCDDFRTSATGAGFIDIPDGTWIMGASFNRDDLLIFTEASTWALKYTGNDTTPFTIVKIDETRGSDAPFATFTYLNRTSAASPRGLIITDGYRVERQDELIPDFSFNEIDGENFELCFAGVIDSDRDHFLIYPSPNQSESKRILVTNYDEDNYCIYRIPLSCMGTFIKSFDITWDDLLVYDNWNELAADYGDWNHFAYNAGAPFSLGGGHKGEIWTLNDTQSEDNPVKIRDLVQVDNETLRVTTDWNNFSDNDYDDAMGADVIFLTGVEGMEEVNNKQYPIKDVINHYTFDLDMPITDLTFNSYTGGGIAARVIPFSAKMKKFNPFVNSDKKVRCGWLYMYVDATGTRLTRNIAIASITQANPCVITTQVEHNLHTGDQVSLFLIDGMTELNGQVCFITVLSSTTFSLDGINSTGYTEYDSGGYAAVAVPAKIEIDVYVNDVDEPSEYSGGKTYPYQGSCTNLTLEDGSKKWYKVFINQTGRFIQFRFRNNQCGAKIRIQAMMPGFAGVGRLI